MGSDINQVLEVGALLVAIGSPFLSAYIVIEKLSVKYDFLKESVDKIEVRLGKLERSIHEH